MSDTAIIPHDVEPHPLTGMYNGKFGLWLFLASEVMLFGALFSAYVLLRTGAAPGEWPRGEEILDWRLAMFNTLVLITSSVTMVMAWAELKLNHLGKAKTMMALTCGLASLFLVVKYFEYKGKFEHYQIDLNAPMVVAGHETRKITGHHLKETEDAFSIEPDAHGDAAHGGAAHEAITVPKTSVKRTTNFGPAHSTFLATYFTLTGLHGLHILGGILVIGYFVFAADRIWKWNPDKLANRVECTGLYWHFVDLVWIFLFPVLYLL